VRAVEFKYLSQEDVITCGGLDMAATLKDVVKATVMSYKGEAIEATTASLFWDLPKEEVKIGYPSDKRCNIHAAYLGGDINIVGIKNIPSVPDNPIKQNMPRASAFITLCSAETGYPIELMEGSIISGMRTGALAGMGVKYLAPSGPCVVGLVGAGPINQTCLMAVDQALKEVNKEIDFVKIFDLRSDRAKSFEDRMESQLNIDIRIASSAEEAVRESDIVVPATTVRRMDQAYIEYSWLKQGCLLSDMSLYDEKLEVLQKSDMLVINTAKALARTNIVPGNLIVEGMFKEEQFVDIAQIVEGELPGREREDQIIVYMARGMAIYDTINAYRVHKIAEERAIGQTLALWKEPYWH